MTNQYRDLNTYFKQLFGERVHKITIDAGFNCPNRDGTLSAKGCIYCNTKGSGTGNLSKGISIAQQIETGIKAVSKRFHAKKFMAYFQSFTNTYAPVHHLKKVYDEALCFDDVVGIAIGTRPDCVDDTILNLLETYTKTHLIWIEYGLQSAHNKTLELINRGHDVNCFTKAVDATRNRGIQICAHVVLGLPGETRKDMLETAKFIGDLHLDGVKIHLLYVIKNTPLETLYRSGEYMCLEQHEYIRLVCDFIERLPTDMVIHRLTGDPHPSELAAPLWALKKQEIISDIKMLFEERDSWQGKYRDQG